MRISGEFRELVANRSFSDEEIGKIVRCLAMETDFFLTPRIEAEVYHYRKVLERKRKASERVKAIKRRKLGIPDGESRDANEAVDEAKAEPAVGAGVFDDTNSCPEKTPTNPQEKTPPIIPLKKNPPASLENCHRRGRPRTDRDKLADGLQQNLFAFVAGGGSDGGIDVPPKSAREGGLERDGGEPVQIDVQDIERDSRGVLAANDTRSDLAWIPERFSVFWSKYPRRIAKASAVKTFTKIIKGQKDVEKFMKTLLASLEWWQRQDSWKKENGKYVPYPATWLNRGCWADINEQCGEGHAEFLNDSQESDEELIRRMGGQ